MMMIDDAFSGSSALSLSVRRANVVVPSPWSDLFPFSMVFRSPFHGLYYDRFFLFLLCVGNRRAQRHKVVKLFLESGRRGRSSRAGNVLCAAGYRIDSLVFDVIRLVPPAKP
jgi:hypothetical protein